MNLAQMLMADVKPLGYWPTHEQAKKKRPPRIVEGTGKTSLQIVLDARKAKSDAMIRDALGGKAMTRQQIADAVGRTTKSLTNIITRQIAEGKLMSESKAYGPHNRKVERFRWNDCNERRTNEPRIALP